MKLRFNGNSIRLRLSQTDVQHILEGNDVVESVHFGGVNTVFNYAFKIPENGDEIQTTYHDNEIAVWVPKTMAIEWAAGNEVGLYHDLAAGNSTLSITIEKDFQCLH